MASTIKIEYLWTSVEGQRIITVNNERLGVAQYDHDTNEYEIDVLGLDVFRIGGLRQAKRKLIKLLS